MHGIAPQAVWRVRPQGLFRSCRAAFAWRTTHTTTCPTARRQGRPFPLVERAPGGRAGMACHGHRIAESAVAQPKRRSRGVSGLLRDTRATVVEHARVPRAPCIRRTPEVRLARTTHPHAPCYIQHLKHQWAAAFPHAQIVMHRLHRHAWVKREMLVLQHFTLYVAACWLTLFLYLLYCLGATARSHAAPAAAQIFTRKFYKMVAMLAETFVRT